MQKGGELDLHGKLFAPTWTRLAQARARSALHVTPHRCSPLSRQLARGMARLAAPTPRRPSPPCRPAVAPRAPLPQTANAGASQLVLQDPVRGWEAGQHAVVTTTIWKDEQVGGWWVGG